MSDKNIPEVPEWAYKLSEVFQDKSCSVPEVEKSIQKIIAKIPALTLEDFQNDVELSKN